MTVSNLTPPDLLRGVLPVVITGGRPLLKQRSTARFLPDLRGVTADPIWICRDDEAGGYEQDDHEMVTYSRDWAEGYASAHWTGIDPMVPGESFLGAFPGREWACRTAEERGCWAVFQLDDNIIRLVVGRRSTADASRIAREEVGLGMFADVLSAVKLSTNGGMVGAFMTSVPPTDKKIVVSRTGFPYSLFLERTGSGREEWYGPHEDDITHAYQYGSSPSKLTALLVPMLAYMKESQSQTGMRKNYDSRRSVTLQRMFPQTAKIGVRAAKSNGRGGPRVFHTMIPGAIRTPMIITDHDQYAEVSAYLSGLIRRYASEYRASLSARVEARAAGQRWKY